MIKTEDVIVVKTAALTFYVVIMYSAHKTYGRVEWKLTSVEERGYLFLASLLVVLLVVCLIVYITNIFIAARQSDSIPTPGRK